MLWFNFKEEELSWIQSVWDKIRLSRNTNFVPFLLDVISPRTLPPLTKNSTLSLETKNLIELQGH